MPKIPNVYDRIGDVLQAFKSEGYSWVSREDIAKRFAETFPTEVDKLDTHDVRPYIPGMMSHYIGDNEEPKKPLGAPRVVRQKSGTNEGYAFA